MSLPYFRCYPSDFLDGMSDLNHEQTSFYIRLIFRMYDSADAIYMDDKRVGKMANSNARAWRKVRAELVAMGKLYTVPPGLPLTEIGTNGKPKFAENVPVINKRFLRYMLEYSIENKGKSRQPSDEILTCLAKLSLMFAESLPKVCRKFSETFPKFLNENNGGEKQPIPVPIPMPDEDNDKSLSSWDEDELFNKFWLAFPNTQGQSKRLTFEAWVTMTEGEKIKAFNSCHTYEQMRRSNPKMGLWQPRTFLKDEIYKTLVGEARPKITDEMIEQLRRQK